MKKSGDYAKTRIAVTVIVLLVHVCASAKNNYIIETVTVIENITTPIDTNELAIAPASP
jgi:hypothetical protein